MAYHPPNPGREQRGKSSGLMTSIIQAEKLMQIALILPCAVFIGWLGGHWIDRIAHTSWVSLIGIVFGGASGLVYVIRLAMQANKDPALRDTTDSDGKGGDGAGS
jgi:F0F1-type ATP synthase assembly protein I